MRSSIILFISVLLSIFQTKSIFAQECQLPLNSENVSFEKVEKPNPENYKDWKEYKTKYLTFYAPDNMKDPGGYCIHGECETFKNEEMLISIDKNIAAYYPTFQRSRPGYNEKIFCISGRIAWYWFSPDETKKDIFYSGVYFYFNENPKRRLVMIFNFKERNLDQVTEKIVKSIEIIK